MKILVCISCVPDTTSKISFKDSKTFNTEGIQFIINPYDEFGLTKALQLKEAIGGTITVVTVGQQVIEPVIRKALAIGADEAIRVNAQPTDAFFVANEISNIAKDGSYDLIIAGRESIDYNGGQVAGMLGALLDIPSVTPCIGLDVEGNDITITKLTDSGKEVLTTQLPAVIGSQKGLVDEKDLRIPNMRGIMMARSKPLKVIEPIETTHATEYCCFELPPSKAACKLFKPEEVQNLVNALHSEAKII